MASKLHERTYRHLRRDIPPEVLAVSPVSTRAPQHHGGRGLSLPLNVIAIIIGYIDDTADIARVTRTCRLMYYMTLPQLYSKVTLRSYADLRYIDGKPEGYGSGSPFTMALSGLATSNSAALVNDFEITGSWTEPQIEDYSKGKVPDSTMLLGIALRAAIDKMSNMKSFSWSLEMKPLKTIYQGLATRNNLVSLSLRFPSNRAPRHIVTIPPIPNLRKLRVSNIDPICYPDDLSVLLLQSKKLEDLRMHWSPRMRQEAEPTLNLRIYFGKCLESNYKLPVKHLAFQNYYGVNTGDLKELCNPDTMRSTDFINCFGGIAGEPATIFIDGTWTHVPGQYFRNIKSIRISEAAEEHARLVGSFSGLEELYFVNPHNLQTSQNGSRSTPTTEVVTPSSAVSSLPSPNRTPEQASVSLCKQYLFFLFNKHGHSLKHLLLDSQWALSGGQIAELVSSCPNLEQLGIGLSGDEPYAIRILAPFLKNTKAIRILHNEWLDSALQLDPELQEVLNETGTEPMTWKIPLHSKMEWAGIGDKVYRIGKPVQVPDEEGRLEWRREAYRATLDDVKDVAIWSKDCLEI